MKTLQELYTEITVSDDMKKAFAEAAKNNNVVDFAKSRGVETTLDEIRTFLEEKAKIDKELSNDELENAAGGNCIIPSPDTVISLVGAGLCNNEPIHTSITSNCI